MKTINDNDQWFENLAERLSTVSETPETDMLDSILALAAGKRRRRKTVIMSVAGLVSASAAALALFLMPGVEHTANRIPAPVIAEAEAASVVDESIWQEYAVEAASAPVQRQAVSDSPVADVVEATAASSVLSSPAPGSEEAAPSRTDIQQDVQPSAWDPAVWSNLLASEDKATRKEPRRLRLSVGSNASFAEGMKGNPFALAVSSVRSDMDYRKSEHKLTGTETRSSVITSTAYEQSVREDYQRWFTNSFPISLNIALSYDITDRLAVESGVTYTLLTLSRAVSSNITGDSYEDRYNIDFIGIPLSVRYNFDNWRRTDLYVRGGGMVEMITSTGALTPQFSANSRKIAGRTPFLSLSAGAGLQYNFNKVTGLYLEPGLSYHFDNDMIFATPYGNTPMAFDLHAGLRVNLN